MNYELALELKNAGFPYDWCEDIENCDPVEYPSLEELIEACGDKLGGLFRAETLGFSKGWAAVDKKAEWIGESIHMNGGTMMIYLTPNQAVARLWIALNKKF